MLLYQMVTWKVNVYLVLAALAIIGVPGAIGLATLARGKSDNDSTPEKQSSDQLP